MGRFTISTMSHRTRREVARHEAALRRESNLGDKFRIIGELSAEVRLNIITKHGFQMRSESARKADRFPSSEPGDRTLDCPHRITPRRSGFE
jgi:hypothetical protein